LGHRLRKDKIAGAMGHPVSHKPENISRESILTLGRCGTCSNSCTEKKKYHEKIHVYVGRDWATELELGISEVQNMSLNKR
jgi:hypothetical protein